MARAGHRYRGTTPPADPPALKRPAAARPQVLTATKEHNMGTDRPRPTGRRPNPSPRSMMGNFARTAKSNSCTYRIVRPADANAVISSPMLWFQVYPGIDSASSSSLAYDLDDCWRPGDLSKKYEFARSTPFAADV